MGELMQEIARQIFIECYPDDVVVGFIKMEFGLVLIDAPYQKHNQLSWLRKIEQLGGNLEKYLVMLDTHIDRTFGICTLETNVIGHCKALDDLQSRTGAIRQQDLEQSSALTIEDLTQNPQWTIPNMVYSHDLNLYLNGEPVSIFHMPGAHPAGSWLRHDTEKVVFVGDSVVINQPPFLGLSDLNCWIKELNWLISGDFNNYKVVSGRNGLIEQRDIVKLINLLTNIKELVQGVIPEDSFNGKMEELLSTLSKMFNFDPKNKGLYQKRLSYGLEQYLHRHCVGLSVK
jgi:hypothetical protein